MLRPGGAYLYVVPAARHLWQLKEVLYDRPYPNEERETPYEGFAYQEILPVSFTVHLPAQADIRALFQMTPYYWKTPRQGAARLAALETLACEMAFHIHVFRREAALRMYIFCIMQRNSAVKSRKAAAAFGPFFWYCDENGRYISINMHNFWKTIDNPPGL